MKEELMRAFKTWCKSKPLQFFNHANVEHILNIYRLELSQEYKEELMEIVYEIEKEKE